MSKNILFVSNRCRPVKIASILLRITVYILLQAYEWMFIYIQFVASRVRFHSCMTGD